MDKRTDFKAYLAYISVCILWGTTYLAIKIGVAHTPPFLFAGLRWLLSGIVFLLYLRIRGIKFPKKNEVFHMTVIGVCLLGFGNGLLNYAEQWIPSGLSSLLIATIPFWIVGMEIILPSGPRLNIYIATGLILGLVSVAIIFGNDINKLANKEYMTGILSILILVIFWSFGSVYSKYIKLEVHPFMSAAVQMLVGGIVLTIAGISLGELARFSFDTNGLIAFLYLFGIASIVGYSSYIYMITHLPLSFASTYAYINPVIALFLGWLFLNEKIDISIFVGTAVIFTGVILVKKGIKQHEFFKNKIIFKK